jgi:hypothetical protein
LTATAAVPNLGAAAFIGEGAAGEYHGGPPETRAMPNNTVDALWLIWDV